MSSIGRAERRRRERAEQRLADARERPVIIAGDGVIAATLGSNFKAVPHAQLPPKVEGVHRWIATAAFVVTVDDIRSADDPDRYKFLDHENLMQLAIGCWDCEQPLGVIDVDTRCPGDPS